MSRPIRVTCKCAVCGLESEQTVLASSNQFGSPDLDLRPPEMMRSTMSWWIQECPVCGYISEDISDETNVDAAWLLSDEYLNMAKREFASPLASRYYKYYLINMKDENPEDAFYAILHAAWVCDDKEDAENALFCRRTAISVLPDLMEMEPDNENLVVMKADILRRARLFSELIEEYTDKELSKPLLNQIIAFQIEKAKIQDTNCYTVKDVVDANPEKGE